MSLDTPVALLIFNRPEPTAKVFEVISKVKPKTLLVVADGSRFPDEEDKCRETRQIIEQVDWECNVIKNYADHNLGCRNRVSSGITWVFDTVEEAIILEDDCVPSVSFFYYCQTLLEYYRNDTRVMHICGSNKQFGRRRTPYSYYFSKYNFIWGWASWRRAWKHYDVEMKTWPHYKHQNFLGSVCEDVQEKKYWEQLFDIAFNQEVDTWDYQWTYACWANHGLSIVPNVNLISNIGFGADATHTKDENIASYLPTEDLWDISHPPVFARHATADLYTYDLFFGQQTNHQRNVKSIKEQITSLQKELAKRDETLKKVRKKLKRAREQNQAFQVEISKSKNTRQVWNIRYLFWLVTTLGGLFPKHDSLTDKETDIVLPQELPTCPLTNQTNVQLLKAYDSQDLITRWKRGFQIDITDELKQHPYLYLYQCNETKLKFFTPKDIVGSGYLYEQLEKFDWYYMPRKWEHDAAIPDLRGCQTVLEVGSGRGAFVNRLRTEHQLDAQGIELNSSAVHQALEQNIPIAQMDLHVLAEKQPESFDAVCSFQVLEHVPDPKEFLTSMIRLVKPHGKVILAVPNADTFTRHAPIHLLDQPPHHVTQWNQETFQKLTTLLPLKVKSFKFEPLAEYHIDWYCSIQMSRVSKDFIWRDSLKQWVDGTFKPLLRSSPWIRKRIRGHTIYVCFERVA
jgi:2-polyprenyl-3-methyl-5-hydroxy-6-metoxy-1,4-benzoquinol methylase